MIKAVIFDFGGVVVNCSPQDIETFVSKAFSIPVETVERTLFSSGEDLIEGKISDEVFWNTYAQSIERPLPTQWETLLREFLIQAATLNHEVIELLKDLKGKFLLPLLSNIAPFQAKTFKNLGYFDHFNPLILSCEVGFKKPNPKFFQYLLNQVCLQPNECCFIDDEKKNIDAALHLGMRTIHYHCKGGLHKQLKKIIQEEIEK